MDSASRKRGAEEKEHSERPVRRSRMVSEDAKLAMKLQQEEDKKAWRAAVSPAKPVSAPPPKPSSAAGAPKAKKDVKGGPASKKPTHSAPAAKRGGKVGAVERGRPASAEGGGRQASPVKKLPNRVIKTGGGGRTWKCRGEDEDLVATALLVAAERKGGGGGSRGGDPEGKVSFTLSPFENSLPAMRRGASEQVWEEDQTVMQIKRHVAGDIWQGGGGDHTMLCLRTPSGLLLGNDHSLRYVRSVLWPPSQGKLNILYSKQLPGVGLL